MACGPCRQIEHHRLSRPWRHSVSSTFGVVAEECFLRSVGGRRLTMIVIVPGSLRASLPPCDLSSTCSYGGKEHSDCKEPQCGPEDRDEHEEGDQCRYLRPERVPKKIHLVLSMKWSVILPAQIRLSTAKSRRPSLPGCSRAPGPAGQFPRDSLAVICHRVHEHGVHFALGLGLEVCLGQLVNIFVD